MPHAPAHSDILPQPALGYGALANLRSQFAMWRERKLRATSQLGGDLDFGSVLRLSLSRR